MKRVFIDPNIERIGKFVDKHLDMVPTTEGNVPSFSSIEFSINGACNRRCKFCPRVDDQQYPNIYDSLDFDVYKRVIDDLAAVNYSGRISYSGFSEPLLTKNLEEYITYAKEACPKITIEMVSNGDALSLERLKSIFDAGLDNMRLSLYDGPEQDIKFKDLQKQAGLNDEQVILRQRYLSSADHFGITLSNRAGAINLKEDNVELKALEEPLEQACYYPFYKLMVDYDGAVMICSNDWLKKLIVGNVKDENVFEIWNGKKFNFARQRLSGCNRKFAPCDVCDVNGLMNGKPHFDAWHEYYQSKDSNKD